MTVTLGAGPLLAPEASAAGRWRPGYPTRPSGDLGASHLGSYTLTIGTRRGFCTDPTLYSYLAPESIYALPEGKRVLERLTFPNVATTGKNTAMASMAEAFRYFYPHKINLHLTEGPVQPSAKTPLIVDATSVGAGQVAPAPRNTLARA
ncbi:hypothetical protein AB0P17_24290 [Streptomyces sp. NPDC088124]|uniref:hypothetical protein n=1 Tax=Streptomyces sp. NPDC088124 TaxID=3154654 RepID=UPI0034223DC5